MTDFQEQIDKEWEKYKAENSKANILLLGKTGCGKSSLINYLFGKEVATVSDVESETMEFKVFKGENINLIDSRGYELGNLDFGEFVSKVTDYVDENSVDVVWYAISIAGHRIEESDIKVLKHIAAIPHLKKRICVVLTKCDEDDELGSTAKEFKAILRKEGYNEVFEVSNDKEIEDILEGNKLLEYSATLFDNDVKRQNFIKSQVKSLELKKKEADSVINMYTAMAVAAVAEQVINPLPGSDIVVLTGFQIKMIVAICHVYNLDGLAKVASIGTDLLVGQIGKKLAQMAVGTVLKLLPGIGSIAGTVINATVAGTITKGLGHAVSEYCYAKAQRIIKGEKNVLDNFDDFDLTSVIKANF